MSEPSEKSELLEFISRDEFREITLSMGPQERQKFLDLINEGLTRCHNKAVETAMLSMPDFVLYLLRYTASRERMCQEFLAQNLDLKDDAGFKSAVVEVESGHAGWRYEQVLGEAGRLARERRSGAISLPIGFAGDALEKPSLGDADDGLNGAL